MKAITDVCREQTIKLKHDNDSQHSRAMSQLVLVLMIAIGSGCKDQAPGPCRAALAGNYLGEGGSAEVVLVLTHDGTGKLHRASVVPHRPEPYEIRWHCTDEVLEFKRRNIEGEWGTATRRYKLTPDGFEVGRFIFVPGTTHFVKQK